MSNPISLTVMAKNFEEDDVSRSMLYETLLNQGFLCADKANPITKKGFESGLSYKYGQAGSKWVVYDDVIQERLKRNVGWMLQHFPNLKVSVMPPKKEEPDNQTTLPFASDNSKYRYILPGIEDFVIIDSETTGLDEDDEIVELAVVDSTGETIYHSFYCPDKEVSPGAVRVNHLSKDILKEYGKFDDSEWKKVKEAIGNKPIVGHNVEFDKRLIVQTLSKNNVDISTVGDVLSNSIDTMKVAKKHIKSKSYSLNNLTTLIGITREEQHTADDDCRMTLEFLDRLDDILTIRNEYNFVS